MEQHHFSTKTAERPVHDVELGGPRNDGYQAPILVVPHSDHEELIHQQYPLERISPLKQERISLVDDGPRFANSAPLGLCAFALTSFVSNSTNVYIKNVTSTGINIALPLAYGGLVQLFAGIWEMVVGNTFGATSFCSYGAYWITFGVMSLLESTDFESAQDTCAAEQLMGVFMMVCALGILPLTIQFDQRVMMQAWFIFTTLMLLCTLKSSLAMFLLFFFLDMNYLILGIAHLKCHADGEILTSIRTVGGIFGLLAALTAWYNAFAGVFDTSNGFFTVPLGHFPWSPAFRAHRAKVKAI
ncbi:hypothetical protein N7540_010694 [Penicillium herquei]|nr:hypothetical protein N7540_010694 [Penicillium herquei]